ncbi:dihydrolipoyllysine-residue succinyltransferase component of 2-oxoglutarate dehydrogenase complex [Sideroxyarcus emersonii]|uniref:Dihydrolipoyllysine-residue succinyltransferase component of 2-oxoglutarate dehydrogenase complex n=1 Tax=Sideroxyarcus emersonii TaxID=2764705 RepID=A0AAN1XAH1_9PROT|nr:2-oxoglutarate dehydrogenase complex dihydrolipoyllysine-residue succinyltransferase [Sideroxyarcus emersonii]BCK87810.1 dihydrolipoyllysine-residue succinyltransferase component of 2-oxoglutarate dehydrogenase complex [Sideroxyarcus emersonii]
MSIIEVKVPQLSESVSEATLLTWQKKIGEAVREGENLIDIETDKVVLELPAIKSGVLSKIIKADGAKVASGEVIAQIDTEGSVKAAAAPAAPAAAAPGAAKAPAQAAAVSPSARKLAHAHDVDAASLQGSGRHGLVTREDVLEAVQQTSATASQPAVAPVVVPAGDRPEQRVPMTRIRQRIAERLLQSQANAAILTTFNEVNMQPVIELRNKYKEAFEKKHGVKLGFSSFFVKAAVLALQKFPVVNASVDGTDIIYHGYFDIGMAIGSERGLVVPILRDADQLSLADIEKRIADFAARAKDGKLTMEELSGGTFSITNGGVFGSMLSTPIINPPQSAILGIHATKDRPVAENGQVVIRPMNYLALSYDHRIIDGREAVQFLGTIKEALEYPGRVLLDL